MIRKSINFFNIKAAFALLVFFVFFSNCSKEKFKSYEFQIYVDSIVLADTIQAGNTLEIEFYGIIGRNGCVSFERFDTGFSQNMVAIKAIGKSSGANICPTVMVYLDGTILQINNLTKGEFTVKVGQPDDTELVETVIIE